MAGDGAQNVPVHRLTEDIHTQDGFQHAVTRGTQPRQPAPGGFAACKQVVDCLAGLLQVHVAGQRVHIHKDRGGTFIEDDVCGCHKREGRGQHQVAQPNIGSADAQMQPGCAGINANGMMAAQHLPEGCLKLINLRTHAEVGRADYIQHRLHFGIRQVGGRHGNNRFHGGFSVP